MSQGSNPAARTLRDMSTPEGVVTKSGGNYYYKYFLRDYLGNVRDVLSCSKSGGYQEEQFTNYDPLGLAISKIGGDNPYLYNGKELYSDFSDAYEGVYDFGARYYNPLYGRWFAQDPEKQHPNPYIYCGNNPVMKIDPNGMKWRYPRVMEHIINSIQKKLNQIKTYNQRLQGRIDHNQTLGKNTKKLESRKKDNETRIKELNESLESVYLLEADDHIYDLAQPSMTNYNRVRMGDDGVVYIEGLNMATYIHEIDHVVQGLDDGELRFDKGGFLLNVGKTYEERMMMEVNAYRKQYSYDPASLPFTIYNGIEEIDIFKVMNIKDPNRRGGAGRVYGSPK